MATIPNFACWTHDGEMRESQKKSLKKAQLAETTPVSIDPASQSGVFYGSGAVPYHTSLSYCTCSGFARTKLPCKHVYRLAMELGIIDLPYKSGVSKGERIENQLSLPGCVAAIEKLSDYAQCEIKSMLGTTYQHIESRHAPYLVTDEEIMSEFRNCELICENPYPTAEVLSHMDRASVFALIVQNGNPDKIKRNAAKSAMIDWLVVNVPDLPSVLPPAASFSFIPPFDKVQRSVYIYLLRKYDSEIILIDGGVASYPYGSSILQSVKKLDASNPYAYTFYFPEDEITSLLTQYGHNRCLSGFVPTLEK